MREKNEATLSWESSVRLEISFHFNQTPHSNISPAAQHVKQVNNRVSAGNIDQRSRVQDESVVIQTGGTVLPSTHW